MTDTNKYINDLNNLKTIINRYRVYIINNLNSKKKLDNESLIEVNRYNKLVKVYNSILVYINIVDQKGYILNKIDINNLGLISNEIESNYADSESLKKDLERTNKDDYLIISTKLNIYMINYIKNKNIKLENKQVKIINDKYVRDYNKYFNKVNSIINSLYYKEYFKTEIINTDTKINDLDNTNFIASTKISLLKAKKCILKGAVKLNFNIDLLKTYLDIKKKGLENVLTINEVHENEEVSPFIEDESALLLKNRIKELRDKKDSILKGLNEFDIKSNIHTM